MSETANTVYNHIYNEDEKTKYILSSQEVKEYRVVEIRERKFKNKNEPNCCNLIHFLATI
jgi:hypothetical protein